MSKLKIAGATIALVLASTATAFAQTADEDAAKKGGFLGKVEGANVCMAPIRGTDFSTQAYDGQNLGVMTCSGNGSYTNELSGSYCRIFLEPKPRKKTREELEAELEALTEAELNATN